MLFALLAVSARSFVMDCTAPLKHADPPKDAELQVIAIITRHGLRTPNFAWIPKNMSGPWICDSDESITPRIQVSNVSGKTRRYTNPINYRQTDFEPNCPAGALVLEGQYQHYELGDFYQNWLVHEMRFLPRILNPNLLLVRSTYVERTFRSAEAFLSGFYPPAVPGEMITITTGTEEHEPLLPLPEHCKEYGEEYKEFLNDPEVKARGETRRDLYSEIYKRSGTEYDGENWMFIGDFLSIMHCSAHEFPDYIDEEIFNTSVKDVAYYTWGVNNRTRGRAGSPVVRELLRTLDAKLTGKAEHKFVLFSTHDITIAAVLSLIGGIYREDLPRFRSHLAVEIWKMKDGELKIRFAHDGEPVPIDVMGYNTLNNYEDFKKAIQPYLRYCTEYE